MPIVLSDASFSYPDGSLAVDSVTLRINDGERIAIVGQNGAGKTTTVKMMNGLLKPSSGSVTVDGLATTDQTTATTARTVGYVFQNPDDQIFGSDVQGELEYMPKYLKWDAEVTEQRVGRAAKMTGIRRFLKVNPNDLPFAIKKFVAIGAILVGDCKYVILDEPTAGLDDRGLKLLNRMMDQLEAEGVAVIAITHDMRFVVDSFTRVVAMANRKIIADGSCEEVFGNDDVLSRAKLKRPEVPQLARELGLSTTALHLNAVVALIR
ncbi:energy-coupling factor transport system ATP-binding protein [Arthrobacter silviterrae]|uniref:Energy-coupling factor ABC transporter ATP-binding protein n=1 Tax=Arthrobacter silviterrae TaxID=2026658 RepID=A0ABX0DDH1_9MICC|nr:energy-coupling factor ABC transporter ATP-binding protein [Arthrobacter silviterrae]MDQ0276479.1 energy-coupling factor transport system ATP-binding protein [Arthrobacter silviterrae]NGN84683.1 energy-coupling factor ABC transporter ATP-binding protein [Arthrobacter silviterrae]